MQSTRTNTRFIGTTQRRGRGRKMYYLLDERRRVRALRLTPGTGTPVLISGRPPEVACLRMLARVWDRHRTEVAERLAPSSWHFTVFKNPGRGWLLTLHMRGSEVVDALPAEGGILLSGTNESAHSWGDVAYTLVDLALTSTNGDDAQTEAKEISQRLALRSLEALYTPSNS